MHDVQKQKTLKNLSDTGASNCATALRTSIRILTMYIVALSVSCTVTKNNIMIKSLPPQNNTSQMSISNDN